MMNVCWEGYLQSDGEDIIDFCRGKNKEKQRFDFGVPVSNKARTFVLK